MIEDILPRYQAVADGNTSSFTVPFDIISDSYINVYLGKEKQTSGYTINDKTVTFNQTPASSTVVTIVRVLPIGWKINKFGAINEESLNNAYSFLVAKMQSLEEEVSRAVKTDITDTETGSSHFLSLLYDALDTLTQAKTKVEQVQATATRALTDINTAKETTLNSMDSKLETYNSNATTKLETYNSNATTKLNQFNTNAAQKQSAVDSSANNAATSESNAASSANNAATSEFNAKVWAEGTDSQVSKLGGTHSAKEWASGTHTNLENLANVTVSDASNGDYLKYDGSKWVNYTGSISWGEIAGSIENQSDLKNTLDAKQDELISGTNIKTINNTSLLGSGNISVQPTITGAASTITSSDLTASRALVSNSSGKVEISNVTSTELGYLSEATSNIQTQINAKAADSDVVHKTGNETINDSKIFTDAIGRITQVGIIGSSGMVKGEPPSSNSWREAFRFCEGSNTTVATEANTIASYTSSYRANGSVFTTIRAYEPVAGSTNNTFLELCYPANGNPYANAPTPASATDNTIKIATTAWVRTSNSTSGGCLGTFSKDTNGYLKLVNGIIIQWGISDVTSSNKVSVTFLTAFSSDTSYTITCSSDQKNSKVTDGLNAYIGTKTSTGVDLINKEYGTNKNYSIDWIAIGY